MSHDSLFLKYDYAMLIANGAFNYEAGYYKLNNCSAMNPDIQAWTIEKEGLLDWRNQLKEGDMVDVRCKIYEGPIKVWRQGRISERYEQYLTIELPELDNL